MGLDDELDDELERDNEPSKDADELNRERLKEAGDLTSTINAYDRHVDNKGPLRYKEREYAKEVANKLTNVVNSSDFKELDITSLTKEGQANALVLTCGLMKALNETARYDYRNEATKQAADKIWPVIKEEVEPLLSAMDIEVGKCLSVEHRTLQQSCQKAFSKT